MMSRPDDRRLDLPTMASGSHLIPHSASHAECPSYEVMHRYDDDMAALAQAVWDYTRERVSMDPIPLDGPRTSAQLTAVVGQTITEDGIGGLEALRLFAEELAPACISTDHPRSLSFIPGAPTKASALFDVIVGASSIAGDSWLVGAGVIHVENAALRWLADLADLPASAGGVFVSGGTIGNLSALVTARYVARTKRARSAPPRWVIAGTAQAHSSIATACAVMDVDFLNVPVDDHGRLTGDNLRRVLKAEGHDGVFAVSATAGTTNLGIIDDFESISEVCAEYGIWLHVDGAYGGAGLAAPSIRSRYQGIEKCDSFIVDPHKWLYSPFDCCALVYRDPSLAREAHTQKAGYLDIINEGDDQNPADYSIGLTRRPRGLPFWFSLATYGTKAYTAAVERSLEVTRFAAEQIRSRPELELLREPDTSVVAFRRVGWSAKQYRTWSDDLLATGVAFVTPSTHEGDAILRFCVLNPMTTEQDIKEILDTLT
ncbi:MAG: pyridoxal phosphate-dependent decarboxylase family protein [Actinomycetota bacterium]